MNTQGGFGKNQQMILSGVNTVGLVSLLAFVIRSFNEVNQSIEEIKTEFSTLKNSINENNKRANISFNRLNQKIEETADSYKNNKAIIDVAENNLIDLNASSTVTVKKTDEITSAINSLMG